MKSPGPAKSAARSETIQSSQQRNRPARKTSTLDLLKKAAATSEQALPLATQSRLKEGLAADFSTVRVHAGPDCAAASERLGARAYTLGRSIFLGSEFSNLSSLGREQLLSHEAVHAAQQGFRQVNPHAGLTIGKPDSAAEKEARTISASSSLAMRDRMRQGVPVTQRSAPQIQRDLKGPYKGIDGTFDLNLKTESHAGAKNGMSGTIKFNASDHAPDASKIRLLQVVRLEDLTSGKDYTWTGDEANRNKAMTSASKDVNPGFFVDAAYKGQSPRAAKGDAAVSPFYTDYWKSSAADGSKKGKVVTEASLWDYPGWSQNCRFTFETAAKSMDMPYVYATVSWGFTISDASKGKVEKEHAKLNNFPTATFGAAVTAFDEFYKNPGASTAPK